MRVGLFVFSARAIVKRALPSAIVRVIRAHRILAPHERSIYWRSLLGRALGKRHGRPYSHVASPRSVLFVCRGNIIRSPMAAALLKQYLSELGTTAVAISSAGLHVSRDRSADSRALAMARHFGVSLDHHRTQPVTHELVAQADAIFVMDWLNEAEFLGRYPEAKHKVSLLSTYTGAGRPRQIEIADPYDGNETDVRRCYEFLQRSIRTLAEARVGASRHGIGFGATE